MSLINSVKCFLFIILPSGKVGREGNKGLKQVVRHSKTADRVSEQPAQTAERTVRQQIWLRTKTKDIHKKQENNYNLTFLSHNYSLISVISHPFILNGDYSPKRDNW